MGMEAAPWAVGRGELAKTAARDAEGPVRVLGSGRPPTASAVSHVIELLLRVLFF